MKWIHVDSYEKLSRQAANVISAQVILKSHSVLGLATGATPLGTYAQLAEWVEKGDLDFSRVTTVNLDEYVGLAPTHPQSYHQFMKINFFDKVRIPSYQTFIPSGIAEDLEQECRAYDARIRSLGGIDLQILGIGLDGHIGFNEPDSEFAKATHVVDLTESTRQANSQYFDSIDSVPLQAVTVGMTTIMQAKKILLLANGPEKKDILMAALFGPITPTVPASILQLHPDVTVIHSEN